MELKRLRFDEASKLTAVNMRAFAALQGATDAQQKVGDDASMAEKMEAMSLQADAAERFCAAISADFMSWVFKSCVRNVGGLVVDDAAVTTGEGLADQADQKMVIWLLMKLQSHAGLTASEGKASSSPSTSGSEGATPSGGNGASPATSIVPEGGAEHSTAPAIPN